MSFIKDPADVVEYERDFALLLAGDTITSASASVAPLAGITLAPTGKPTTNTPTTVTAWLSGGTVGQRYDVTFRIGTAAGRTIERSIRVTVIER